MEAAKVAGRVEAARDAIDVAQRHAETALAKADEKAQQVAALGLRASATAVQAAHAALEAVVTGLSGAHDAVDIAVSTLRGITDEMSVADAAGRAETAIFCLDKAGSGVEAAGSAAHQACANAQAVQVHELMAVTQTALGGLSPALVAIRNAGERAGAYQRQLHAAANA